MRVKILFLVAFCLLPFAVCGQTLPNVRQTTGGGTGKEDHMLASDLQNSFNGFGNAIAWISTKATAKTEDLTTNGIICSSSPFAGAYFTVKDEIGTAGQYPITVMPASGSGNTFDGAPSFTISSNFESVTFQCDGAGNWIVE